MKANMIKILLAGCDQDLLLQAISMLDDSVQQAIFSIATGDVKVYDSFSLPKPSEDNIKNLILSKNGKLQASDLIAVTKVDVRDYCQTVKVLYTRNVYRWYRSEEDATAMNDRYNNYQSSDYSFRGVKPSGTSEDIISVAIGDWLAYVEQCNKE